MTALCAARGGGKRKTTFGMLAQQVLSLDSGVEWVALEEAGREPRWAWRDRNSGALCAGSAGGNAQIADPLLLMLAEGDGDVRAEETVDDPHHLRFVVLAYGDMVQIVARLGAHAHVTVAASPGIDPYLLGAKLTRLLDGCTQPVLC